MTTTIKTRVGIVGAGPAGLMLSHLLAKSGIDNVAIDTRPRHEIETTHRAGILEDGVVKAIVDSGVSDRVDTDGYEHQASNCVLTELGTVSTSPPWSMRPAGCTRRQTSSSISPTLETGTAATSASG
jgi:2-polyprenyl-6-methoxyphenol hydroxylase-like FAD-dependent oxidoreductase